LEDGRLLLLHGVSAAHVRGYARSRSASPSICPRGRYKTQLTLPTGCALARPLRPYALRQARSSSCRWHSPSFRGQRVCRPLLGDDPISGGCCFEGGREHAEDHHHHHHQQKQHLHHHYHHHHQWTGPCSASLPAIQDEVKVKGCYYYVLLLLKLHLCRDWTAQYRTIKVLRTGARAIVMASSGERC